MTFIQMIDLEEANRRRVAVGVDDGTKASSMTEVIALKPTK